MNEAKGHLTELATSRIAPINQEETTDTKQSLSLTKEAITIHDKQLRPSLVHFYLFLRRLREFK